MTNPWKRRFEPAHRKPKDRLKGAQIAPVHPIQPVVCGRLTCGHPRLIHDTDRCLRVGCDCTGYLEVPA